MIPKNYRAWDNKTKSIRDVLVIDWLNGLVDLEDGIIERDFKEIQLMQSTGLKDKNGVEIFEGDIIGSQDKDRPNWYVSHHEIVWHDAGFMGKQICSSSFIGLDFWTRGANGYVVIGNIYENPELLKEVKK
ncbi:YopX family protein [Enterococcus sp. ZJ1668]|uniref:YopX family protein n=1 Tax=Enterococcus sp. ZJ1668 TaxID=2709402 RepID=UPI0013E9A8ED|nr:YopX family protein [Enterococcus sp. ZJ1668]